MFTVAEHSSGWQWGIATPVQIPLFGILGPMVFWEIGLLVLVIAAFALWFDRSRPYRGTLVSWLIGLALAYALGVIFGHYFSAARGGPPPL